MKTKDEMIEVLKRHLYTGLFGNINLDNEIESIASELSEKEQIIKDLTGEKIEDVKTITSTDYPAEGRTAENWSTKAKDYADHFKEGRTDEEKEAIEFIAENPECEKYWMSKVKHFMNERDEPDDDSCKLADEWQKQFEIAINAFRKWALSLKARPGDEMSPRIANLILKVREAFIQDDYENAWHYLYQIASPNFDKTSDVVWTEIEKLAAQKAQPRDEQYPKIELNKIFECGGLLYSIAIPQKASIETNLSHGRIICEFERSIDLDNFIPASKK